MILTVAAVDPGTTTCGVCVLKFDTATKEIVEINAKTIRCDKVFRWNSYEKPVTPDEKRKERLKGLTLELRGFFRLQEVDLFIVESGFIRKKTASAFGPLVEAMITIERVASEMVVKERFYKITPPRVRQIIGAGAEGKGTVLSAVMALIGNELIDLRLLDDNAIDAIAIALSYICMNH